MGNALEFLPIPPSPLPKLLHLPSSTSVKVVVVVGAGKKPVLSLKARKYRMQRSKRRQNAFLLLNLGKMEHKKISTQRKRENIVFFYYLFPPLIPLDQKSICGLRNQRAAKLTTDRGHGPDTNEKAGDLVLCCERVKDHKKGGTQNIPILKLKLHVTIVTN